MDISGDTHIYTFYNQGIPQLNEVEIQRHSFESGGADGRAYYDLMPVEIELNSAAFNVDSTKFSALVHVIQLEDRLIASCSCDFNLDKLCMHQSRALSNIIKRSDLLIYFDRKLRLEKLKQHSASYGQISENELDSYFYLEYGFKNVKVKAKASGLLPLTREFLSTLKSQLFIKPEISAVAKAKQAAQSETFVLLRQHRFYKHLYIDLCYADTTQAGKIKNPIGSVDPLSFLWKADNNTVIKFYSGISRFQNNHTAEGGSGDIEALKAIIRNPLKMRFFLHHSELAENVVSASISAISFGAYITDVHIHVSKNDDMYEITGLLRLNGKEYQLEKLELRYRYFIQIENCFHLVGNNQLLKVIEFLKQHQYKLLIHQSRFNEFKDSVLSGLEDFLSVNYSWIKAPEKAEPFIEPTAEIPGLQRLIYLSESESYILINPVLSYSGIEVPVLSKRQVYAKDAKGEMYTVQRNADAEIEFVSLLVKQHEYFAEQLDEGLPYFHLHKQRFLDENWFLNAFEEWNRQDITVLGFNEIRSNKLNPNKVSITVQVLSGIDWFNTEISVYYGRKKASLKQVYKSIRNKNKYVQLDDGTLGILPQEWREQLSGYLKIGEMVDGSIRTPKINFSGIAEYYDEDYLSTEVKAELNDYQSKFSSFEAIKDIEVPDSLNGHLREYQKHGLNWLNFLDEFNFGGCLADDMGLGKSVQVIAFILTQREKVKQNTNLIVAPASLVFNWQQEIAKFAPSIKVYTLHGSNRAIPDDGFESFEIVLTTYGTLLSDVNFLKAHVFNYIILDESQNIKNPESQRYNAVKLLRSRNKLVLTGTPIENNTFDLYGQLSFACPGLLGSKQYFKDIYLNPIDKFKVRKRAMELQAKISPFILRRTKKQVATELPEKTEIVVHCEMGEEQRKLYNEYEKEFREFITSTNDEELSKNSMFVLKGLTRLRQICNSPVLLGDVKLDAIQSSKIDILLEQIQDKSPMHKILVFSQFVSMLNLIKEKLEERNIGYQYLTGASKNREKIVGDFQSDENKRVFLISLKAGGTGLNLTEADYVYLVDPWWNPAVENQAIDRAYRIGQHKHVMAVRMICPDTVEEKIMKLKDTKSTLIDNLIKSDSSGIKSLSKRQLLELLG